MSMEKRGVVDAQTPPQSGKCCGGQCGKGSNQPQTKEAADTQEDHMMTRLSDAAADARKK